MNEAIIAFVRSQMIARTDNYAVQNQDGSYSRIQGELCDADIEDHLAGQKTLGLYQLTADSKVKWFCLDIDLHKELINDIDRFRDDLKIKTGLLCKDLAKLGIETIIEFSGRRGYHIWGFFQDAQPAGQVKRFLDEIVSQSPSATAPIEVEVFPKQASISEDGYGSLVKLPCGIHRKSGKASEIMDANITPITPDALASARLIDQIHWDGLILPEVILDLNGKSIRVPLTIQRLFNNCRWLRKTRRDAFLNKHLNHEPRVQLMNLLIQPEFGVAGIAVIHHIMSGCSDYDPKITSDFILDGIKKKYHPYNCTGHCPFYQDCGGNPKTPLDKLESLAGEMMIYERDNCLWKVGPKGDKLLTRFTIEPRELLELQGVEVMLTDVKSQLGSVYREVKVENTDWHTKQKLMKAIGHTECTVHCSDNDIQDICSYVVGKVPIRRRGTKTIGLIDHIWVVPGMNLDRTGVKECTEIVAYDRSDDSVHSRIQYRELPNTEHDLLIKGVYDNLTSINDPEIILPIIGWFFAAPLKPIIMQHCGHFPLLFSYGVQGSGKTSTLELMLRLSGYSNPTLFSCTMKQFPFLRALGSTNAIPIVFDEYKPFDMMQEQVELVQRMMRKTYQGEDELKGNADQTTTLYQLTSPMALAGEHKITVAAILERMVAAGFTDAVKKTPAMKQAYRLLANLPLEGFMVKYIPFCLGIDSNRYLDSARNELLACLDGITVAPRVEDNLAVMMLGLKLY